MLAEVLKALKPQSGGAYVDGTIGAGGHAAAILDACGPEGRLLGLDRDPRALDLASRRLKKFGERCRLVQAAFDCLEEQVSDWAPQGVQGILLDLGVSSMQLDDPGRGFSFRFDAPLDMRMGNDGPSAAELLARLPEKELSRVFTRLGEEPFAARIARALVAARHQNPIKTTRQLTEIVLTALPASARRKRKLHPATRVFMALRILVNEELGQLERFLQKAPSLLAPEGILVLISYHSLEDRMIKRALARMANPCTCPPSLPVCACGKKPILRLPRKKPLTPGPQEIAANPRARSARMRTAVRTQEEIG
jgi:16S rRNA (cytosine1402-N4)-methyltransferase